MYSNKGYIIKFLYFTPIFLVLFIILFLFYSWIKISFLDTSTSKVFKYINGTLTITSIIMVMWTYFLSIITNPGDVPADFYPENEEIQDQGNQTLYCMKCRIQRPERSHHCSICNRCILKMDHHCPWIANCVGLKNQKYFYLFLFYSCLLSMSAFIGLVPRFLLIDKIDIIGSYGGNQISSYFNITDSKVAREMINKNEELNLIKNLKENFKIENTTLIRNNINESNSLSDDEKKFISDNLVLISLSTATTLILFFALLFLFGFQTYLICHNLTSIESIKFKTNGQNPYFIPSKIQCMKIILGDSFLTWFIPVYSLNEYNDVKKFKKHFQIVSSV